MTARMPTANEHKWCRSALECGRIFSIACVAEKVLGSSTGPKRTGAGAMLAQLERAGLARKLGRNSFGELLYELTPDGLETAERDPMEVVEPVTRGAATTRVVSNSAPRAPAPAPPIAQAHYPFAPLPVYPPHTQQYVPTPPQHATQPAPAPPIVPWPPRTPR
ncbi:MAG: hypothetical protein AMXMBFR56_47860 [Polyangiaceae bacterium]